MLTNIELISYDINSIHMILILLHYQYKVFYTANWLHLTLYVYFEVIIVKFEYL